MKDNHIQVEAFIQKAIAACSYDSELQQVKSYLVAALNGINLVDKKRFRKETNKKAEIVAKTKQQEWWDMLKKNAANNPDYFGRMDEKGE